MQYKLVTLALIGSLTFSSHLYAQVFEYSREDDFNRPRVVKEKKAKKPFSKPKPRAVRIENQRASAEPTAPPAYAASSATNSSKVLNTDTLTPPRTKNKKILNTWQDAIDGKVTAQSNLGLIYFKGDGIPRDYELAAIWLQKAAEQNSIEAQFNLGFLYYIQAETIDNEYEKIDFFENSVTWFRRAAEQGHAESQFYLGNAYFYGDGVIKDQILSIEWYQKAADQGFTEAQVRLGRMGKVYSKNDDNSYEPYQNKKISNTEYEYEKLNQQTK
ncbi:MAG: sel1 repeat family protein [Nitrosomonas sp.]|nr:sel1 repeat family protein [Nitrosomonas sp.]